MCAWLLSFLEPSYLRITMCVLLDVEAAHLHNCGLTILIWLHLMWI